jgi:ATP synthase protein I
MDDDAEGPPAAAGEAAAWTVLSYVITGPLLYGGIGWLLDRWLGTGFLVAVGLVIGAGLAVFLVNLRYGTR